MSTPSIDLIREFTDEHVGLMIGYFLVNIFTLALETIVLSILLSKIFSTFEKKDGGQTDNIKKLFIMYIGIFVLIRLGIFIKNLLYDEIIPKFFYFLRTSLYSKIIDRYRVDYKELNTGYILYNFEHLPSSFNRLMTQLLQEYIPNALALLICLCYLVYMNKGIGGIVFLGTLLFGLIIGLSIGNSVALSTVEHIAFEQDNEHIQDRINNLFDIYTAGTEQQEKQEYIQLENHLKQSMIDNYKYITTVTSVIEVFSIFVVLFSFYMIYKAYINKTMSTEHIISTVLVLTYFISYMSKLSDDYIGLTDVFGYSKESDRFINEINGYTPATIFTPSQTNNMHSGPIEFKNVNFKYPNYEQTKQLTDKNVLNNVNLYIKPGSKVAIYEKSGSGKSTLIKLLLGFYEIESGLITIGGVSIKDISLEELRKNISVVNQNIKLFDKTIFENMTYGINDNISEDEIMKIIGPTAVNIFSGVTNGLQGQVGVSGSNLSGGQKQIINLVRALLKDTPILILDEPTSALDQNTKKMILQLVKQLKNKTVIIITHDRDFIDVVDKVYELVGGKLKIK